MTKYILAGGADYKHASYATNLRAEISKTVRQPAKVLSCFFAEPREDWETKFTDRRNWFKGAVGNDTEVFLAMPDTFLSQIKEADVVYLHGGDETLLAYYLNSYEQLEQTWKDKIIIGSSAGAEYLARDYWTCDWRQTRSGKGIVNSHIITHFDSEEYGKSDPRGPIDWSAAQQEFETILQSNEAVTILHEGEFIVVEQ